MVFISSTDCQAPPVAGAALPAHATERDYLDGDYYALIEQAYHYGRADQPLRARCLLELAFAEARPQARHLYYGAYLSNLLRDTTAVGDYLLKSVTAGEDYGPLREKDHTRNLIESSGVDSLLQAADAAWRARSADVSTQRLIRELYAVDQHVRSHIFRPNKTEDWAKQALMTTDSLNFKRLLAHIRAVGFPDYFRIGVETQRQLHILLLHQMTDLSPTAFAAVDSLLHLQLKTGNLFPKQYAHMIDRRLQWGLNGPGRYGTLNFNPGGGFSPVERTGVLDSLRATIGLGPLFYVGEGSATKFPVGYVPGVMREVICE